VIGSAIAAGTLLQGVNLILRTQGM
jgi:hypothetical protein